MIIDTLTVLLHTYKINRHEYDTYVLFELDENGKNYLKNIIDFTFLEHVDPLDNICTWHEGRMSLLRDIRHIIFKINQLLGDIENG